MRGLELSADDLLRRAVIGGLMCNVAVIMAGKIPVNLNFTAGRTAIDSAIKRGEIDRFLTADSTGALIAAEIPRLARVVKISGATAE